MNEDSVIRKSSTILLNQRYNTPETSLLTFHFEPNAITATKARLEKCTKTHKTIQGKDIYILDDFFSKEEGESFRQFSLNAGFSRSAYASLESKNSGEKPAKSMNNKEKWLFFINPPPPVKEIYKWFSTLSATLNADITTLPWDLSDGSLTASAFATNYLEAVTQESMEMGKHDDYNPQRGLPFGIPILYKTSPSHFPEHFVNGETGKPWLVTLMLYATSDNFLSDYGMGTIFCQNDKSDAYSATCEHMRLVLFEGDIIHTIQESHIPPNIKPWRISYVYKLIINPRQKDQSVKQQFYQLYA